MERRNTPQSPIIDTQTAPMLKPKDNQRLDPVSNVGNRREAFVENPIVPGFPQSPKNAIADNSKDQSLFRASSTC